MSRPETRAAILQAALELLAEEGFHGAPMARIARHAGVGAGTIYCHFASRDDLIRALFAAIEERILLQVRSGHDEERPTRERFSHLCTTVLDYFIAQPLEFRYLEQFHNSPYGQEYRRSQLFGDSGEPKLYQILFTRGVAEGVIRDLPLVVLFDLTFGPILAVARDHILGFIRLDRALISRIVDACWDAVRRSPEL